MALDVDREILGDFLVEAGEILELLSEQLIQLENSPNDSDLLNAIFRGFHTIKGGAGFLQLTPLVECCHSAENLFDSLRNNKVECTDSVMDAVLEALDSVNDMFDSIRADEMPEDAAQELIERLETLAEGGEVQTQSEEIQEEVKDEVDPAFEFDHLFDEAASEKSEEKEVDPAFEFDHLFDEVAEGKNISESSEEKQANQESDLITEEEFDALLAQIQKAQDNQSVSETNSNTQEENKIIEAKKEHKKPVKKETEKKAPAPAIESNIRVDTSLLDGIMNLVGELVLLRNRMVHLGNEVDNDELNKTVASLDMVTSDLQLSVMKTRMQPVKKVFGKFPRLIRDLSKSLNKEIELTLKGEETGLDKNLVEALSDPLIHLVRNSADHGIEMPDVREAKGKPRKGSVLLSAEQQGDHILLVIQDDGAGMDAEVLKRKAIEKGVIDEDMAAVLSDSEAYALIFHAGFSTAAEVSDISGRGVGMDVVRTKIAQLNGSIDIDSTLGEGTTITIKVPLTLAIMPSLMVGLKNQIFAIPLVNVDEIFDMDLTTVNVVDGQEMITIRGAAYPVYHPKRWLVKGCDKDSLPERAQVVIVTIGATKFGVIVDHLFGQEEIVIKPLDSILHDTAGISGATITGDGGISLILDLPSLLEHYVKQG